MNDKMEFKDEELKNVAGGLETGGGKIYINPSVCNGCGICVDFCPGLAIKLVDGVAVLDQEFCTDCGICISDCQAGAISHM